RRQSKLYLFCSRRDYSLHQANVMAIVQREVFLDDTLETGLRLDGDHSPSAPYKGRSHDTEIALVRSQIDEQHPRFEISLQHCPHLWLVFPVDQLIAEIRDRVRQELTAPGIYDSAFAQAANACHD